MVRYPRSELGEICDEHVIAHYDASHLRCSQTSRFGWRSYQDGLRGHLFLSPDKKQGLVVFKGTSLPQLGAKPMPDDTGRRDRLNVCA